MVLEYPTFNVLLGTCSLTGTIMKVSDFSLVYVPVFIVWLVGQGLNTVTSVEPRHGH